MITKKRKCVLLNNCVKDNTEFDSVEEGFSVISVRDKMKTFTKAKSEINRNPNFQYSEYALEMSQPKPKFMTKSPTIKEASTLLMVLARVVSLVILFLRIP